MDAPLFKVDQCTSDYRLPDQIYSSSSPGGLHKKCTPPLDPLLLAVREGFEVLGWNQQIRLREKIRLELFDSLLP
jgi:hypothetical protein